MFAALFSALWSVAAWLASVLWSVVGGLFSPVPIAVLAVGFGTLYYIATRDYDFWPSRGVPGPPCRLPWGHRMGVRTIADIDEMLYCKYGGRKYCGYMELIRPALHVGDPDLIRSITIKDFEHFTNRREFTQNADFELMLSVLNGPRWKETRAVMSPSFSASKLKTMHQLCLDNATNLARHLRDEMDKNGEIEMKGLFGRFTMDNIASCAFGVNCNSLDDPNSEFAEKASALFKPLKGYALFRILVLMLLPKWIGYQMPDPAQSATEFFKRVAVKTMQHRETSGTSSRRDFLQLLMETKDKDGQRVLSTDSIVMQSVLFFFAGYDTTASLLTFAAYSIATSPHCQRHAHQEIDDTLARHGGQLTYEAFSEMTYMDRVLSETLRLYPPATRIERQCSKEYTLPGTDVTIPAGILVQIPVLEIHRDANHYPDPLKFDPDRFLPEQKEKRHPCAYLPFGSGPRNCIAMRFALFEAKVALVAVLRENTLEPGLRTPPPPMPFDKTVFLMTPKDGSFLKVVARSD